MLSSFASRTAAFARRAVLPRFRPPARLAALALLPLLAACGAPEVLFNAIALPYPGTVTLARDVPFGEGPRRTLDVYAPADPETPLPILVFFYGGAWNTGTKDGYAFAGSAFASEGFLTIVPDYRLWPEVQFPGFVEDGAAAVAWARAHGAEYGGDPDRIVLAGHSAGAYAAAMLALDEQWLAAAGVPRGAIRGWAGLAGPYSFLPLTYDATVRSFGNVTPDALPATQPVNFVDEGDPPAFLGSGGADTIVPEGQALALAVRLHEAGVPFETELYDGIGHIGLVTSLARQFQGRAPILADIADFLHRAAEGEIAGESR